MTKWKYRSCPRCSGDVYVEKDYEETYERCLQCGYINVSSSSSYGFEDAIERETLEETSIKINKNSLKLISVSNDQIPGVQFVTLGFLCEDFEGEAQVMEPDEITEWQWFDLNNLPNKLFFPSAKLIYNYLNKTFYQS